MKPKAKLLSFVICFLLPCVCNAQRSGQPQKAAQTRRAGQIQCAHGEAYAYLYSSMVTMEISTTLKCGQLVTIFDRSDNFLHVRTDAGDDGFVPLNNVLFVKAGAAVKAPATATKREVTHYDDPARLAAEARSAAPKEIILPHMTAVHMKIGRTLSSATAHVGEEVPLEVGQDVVIGGITVIAKGTPAVGAVTEAEPKKRMGKAGKLNVGVTSVALANNQKIALRSYGSDQNVGQSSGVSIPLLRGKDVTLAKDTEITAYVDDDVHLKIASFTAPAQANASPQN
jgi:hypothetical protein